MCALKRIAVEVHNFPMYGRILVRISSRSGLNHTTYGLLYVLLSVLLNIITKPDKPLHAYSYVADGDVRIWGGGGTANRIGIRLYC